MRVFAVGETPPLQRWGGYFRYMRKWRTVGDAGPYRDYANITSITTKGEPASRMSLPQRGEVEQKPASGFLRTG